MKGIVKILMLLSLSTPIYSQIDFKVQNSDCKIKKYRVMWPLGYIDTLRYNLSSNLRSYDNGQIFDDVYYDSTSWVTSVKRYHKSGKLAFEGYVLCCDSFQLNLKRNSTQFDQNRIPDYFFRTYYDNGAIRSSEYYSYRTGKLTSEKIFHHLNGSILYNELITKGDTIRGTFYAGEEMDNHKYLVYSESKMKEIWFVKNPHNEVVTIDKVMILSRGKYKEIRGGFRLRKKLKSNPIMHLTCDLCFQNNPAAE